MAVKARQLAKATTDTMTIDGLAHYAEECEAQAARLKAAKALGPK